MKKNILVLVVVALIIIAGGVYYWYQPKSSTPVPAADAKAVIEKLAKHIILPTNETPEIGRIDDPIQAAKAQPFVSGAQKGDLLIVYVKARRAIVYSPSRDLIVNVGPVSMNPTQTTAPASTTAPVSTTTNKTPVKK
ncbi:MAG: hypothetical protein WC537_00240 [Candidatus Paceibacterota bacterium]|jgi:hypothetical protein